MRGIIFVRTTAHKLFCEIYGIKWDRIGFINDDHLRLYWCIPTEVKPYDGLFSTFCDEINDCIIYYSELNKEINNTKFNKALTQLDRKIVLSVEDQYKEGIPLGMKYVNNVLIALGISEDDLSLHCLSIHNIFSMPKAYTRKESNKVNTLDNIICKDLLTCLINNPNMALGSEISRFRKLMSDASDCLYKIIQGLAGKTLTLDDIEFIISTRNRVLSYLMLPVDQMYLDTDKDLYLLVEIDKSITNNGRKLITIVNNMLAGEKIIDLPQFINIINKTLHIMTLPSLTYEWKAPFSQFIGIVSDDIEKSITLPDKNQKIALSGQGLEKLDSDDLRYLLMFLDTNEEEGGFIELKQIATKYYYQTLEDNNTSK